ncbi:DUF6044 family protein [Butyrivibrio fibrisolvens]|uniref:DUF6044 family protein n=1 Tax=Butyrivibrio fibrisolvens TaxID=831 RepID=UPI0004285C8F|nr:DUF6044 family protein [Butyrivibrio fibrisolvens]
MTDFFDAIGRFFEKFWSFIFVGLFFICTILLYMTTGTDSYLAIHDNLDLFIPQFQMMKNDGTFFALEASTDFLNGISRNVLPSEFSLYTVLYMIFPAFEAYLAGYFIKIVIAMIGSGLLAYDIIMHEGIDTWTKRGVYYIHPVKRDYTNAVSLTVLVSFSYGILNLFPAFGIPFASIPLIIYLLRKAYLEPSFWKFLLIFCYPFLSYFSYHGIFIMGYLVIAIIWIWTRNHKFPWQLALGLLLLGVGSVICEYRLFATMLFSNEPTIRTTMVEADLSVIEILREIGLSWVGGMMHANDAHAYIVLPTCVIYFFYLNSKYLKDGNGIGILHDYYNLCAFGIAFNSVIYGIYNSKVVRSLFEMLVPPLKGWQFNRTIFFNPFLWYASFFIVCYRILLWAVQGNFSEGKIVVVKVLTYLLVLSSIAVILLQPALPFGNTARYDDLFYTAYGEYYRTCHDGKSNGNSLSYKEFYDTELFESLKKEIGYKEGEMCVAYLMYPAQLEYNDISTLDGYLGFYSQEYKNKWRNVIAPALEMQPLSAAYFDNSGIRCTLYSGNYEAVPMYTSNLGGITEDELYIDETTLYDLGCKYIFSRVRITNAEDKNLALIDEAEGIAYNVYVYKLTETKNIVN